jgi:hypothetical protein
LGRGHGAGQPSHLVCGSGELIVYLGRALHAPISERGAYERVLAQGPATLVWAAAPGAPVSAPISWEELDDSTLTPDRITIHTILDRLTVQGDLFSPVLDTDQQLPPLR